MNQMIIDAIGYLGLLINLFSMSLSGEKRLRSFSLIANIIYGSFIEAFPIIIGSSVAVIFYSYRLKKIKNYSENYLSENQI